MPIVGCALAMCDGEGCKDREVVPIMKAPNGQMAGDPPQGWTARVRSVVMPGKGPVELLCPACIKAEADRVRLAAGAVEYEPGTH